MFRSVKIVCTVVVALNIFVSSALAAAKIETAEQCYREDASVNAAGTGFQPGAKYTVTLGGKSLGSRGVSTNGTFTGEFAAPKLKGKTKQQQFTLSATDGISTATTHFSVADFSADFAPSTGNIKKVKVRFTGTGFGSKESVFLHYVSPGGILKRTSALGKTTGLCGSLRSAKRRLFPFDPGKGAWTLQLDTSKKYSKKTESIRIGVTVSG